MERHRQIIGCSRDRSRETNFNVESGRQTEGNNCMTRTNSSQDSRTTRFNIDHADRVSFPVFPFYRHPHALLSLPPPLSPLPTAFLENKLLLQVESWRRFRYRCSRRGGVMQQDRERRAKREKPWGWLAVAGPLLIRMMALCILVNARGTNMTRPPVTLP